MKSSSHGQRYNTCKQPVPRLLKHTCALTTRVPCVGKLLEDCNHPGWQFKHLMLELRVPKKDAIGPLLLVVRSGTPGQVLRAYRFFTHQIAAWSLPCSPLAPLSSTPGNLVNPTR